MFNKELFDHLQKIEDICIFYNKLWVNIHLIHCSFIKYPVSLLLMQCENLLQNENYAINYSFMSFQIHKNFVHLWNTN